MFEGGGNIPLILPIVARLMARGHKVRVVAGPSIRRPNAMSASEAFLDRIIAATGASVTRLPEPATHPLPGRRRRGLAFGWAPSQIKATDLALTSRWSGPWAEGVTAELGREAVDAVVADYFLLGALAAAERAELPTAALVHTSTLPWPLPGVPPPGTGFNRARHPGDHARDAIWGAACRRVAVREGLPSLNEARRSLGLNPLASPYQQYDAAARVLVLGSRSFDLPARRLPDNVRYVGTPFDESTPPEWNSPWSPDDARPLLLVSLSTLPQGQGPVMQRILVALGELPVRALVTLGPSLDAADFHAPPNVRLEVFVPHQAVLNQVAAVITQCGFSTVTKALAHGVPLLCLPVLGDQPDNAARVVAVGAGIRLRPSAPASDIKAAVHRLLDEPRFGEAARGLSVGLTSSNASDSAADELESLALPDSAQTA